MTAYGWSMQAILPDSTHNGESELYNLWWTSKKHGKLCQPYEDTV